MNDVNYYTKLASTVDEILEELKKNPSLGGKSWSFYGRGKLHCTGICKTIYKYPPKNYGDEEIHVHVCFLNQDEYPSRLELREYMENMLSERGYNVNVYVK